MKTHFYPLFCPLNLPSKTNFTLKQLPYILLNCLFITNLPFFLGSGFHLVVPGNINGAVANKTSATANIQTCTKSIKTAENYKPADLKLLYFHPHLNKNLSLITSFCSNAS
jgi:hypothetical protein